MSSSDFSQHKPIPGVSELFSERWSPRAFSEYQMPDEQLERLIDAARWAKNASVIGFIVGKKSFARNDKSNDWFQLDGNGC
ncbi:MAG: hypothetical protein MI867_24075 [Pseudomonadales bacterium]|nr:hypothetical protein [Pseudomonadales bacterium]